MDFNFLTSKLVGHFENDSASLSDGAVFIKWARRLVCVLIFLIPLFFLPWTSEILEFNKQFLLLVLLVAVLILYVVEILRTSRLVFKKSFVNYAVLIFLAVIILVSIFSDFRYQSIFGGFGAGFYGSLISLASFGAFFFFVLNIFGSDQDSAQKDAYNLFEIFCLSLFLAVISGVLNLLGVPIFKLFGIDQNFFNTAGNLNSLGILASILLVYSFSKVRLHDVGLYSRYLKIPAIFLSLFLLLLINWWVLWVVVISGLIFTVILNSVRERRILKHLWPLIVIFLAVVSIFINLNLSGFLGVSMPIEVSPSFRASFEISRDVLMKDPLFGVGPENFSLAFYSYKPLSINNSAFWNVKFSESASEFLNGIVSWGTVGFAAFVFLIFAVFKISFKDRRFLPVFASFITAYVLYPYNMTLGFGLWLVIGVIALSDSETSVVEVDLEKSPRHSVSALVSFICIMFLAAAALYFAISRYAADVKFAKAFNTEDMDRRIQFAAEAVNLNKNEDLYSRSLAGLLVSRINQEFDILNKAKTAEERQASFSKIQNFSASAVNLVNNAAEMHKENPDNWFSKASIYDNLSNFVDGAAEQAVKNYQEYSKFSPGDPEPYLRIGNIYLTESEKFRQANQAGFQVRILENLKLAEENYQKTLELKPNYVLAVYNLGVVYERQGRLKNAIVQLELVKSANLQNANLALELGLLYYRDGQKDRSFAELERAISIFPDFSNARWYLALLLEESGRLDDALNELNGILKSNPDNQVLKDKIKALEVGKRAIPPQKVTGIKPLEEDSKPR